MERIRRKLGHKLSARVGGRMGSRKVGLEFVFVFLVGGCLPCWWGFWGFFLFARIKQVSRGQTWRTEEVHPRERARFSLCWGLGGFGGWAW